MHSQKHIYKIIVCIPICSLFPPITPDGQSMVLSKANSSINGSYPTLSHPSLSLLLAYEHAIILLSEKPTKKLI